MSRATDAVYRLLPDYMRDADTDTTLYRWLALVTEQMATAVQVLDDADPATSASGTCAIATPDAAPAAWLPWLADVSGVPQAETLPESLKRTAIADPATRRRGTTAAIAAAAQHTLTGSKLATVITHPPAAASTAWVYDTAHAYDSARRYDGHVTDPWRIIVITWSSETPDPAATLAAVTTEKPAGCTIEVQTLTGLTYAQLAAKWPTYTAMTATGYTYGQLAALTS